MHLSASTTMQDFPLVQNWPAGTAVMTQQTILPTPAK